jgi:hypothetical protein
MLRVGALVALLTLGLAGCYRAKSWDSFISATTPNPPGQWKGDPYASAGIADSTGGLNTKNPYSQGAKTRTTAPLDAAFNRPNYGTGQRPGEIPGTGGGPNGPVAQPR